MEPFTSSEQGAYSSKQANSVVFAVVALIIAMVALSIVGSAVWRPEPLTRVTLELGNATPVRLAPATAHGAIASVLQSVAPTVAFITLPDLRRSGSGVLVHAAGFVVTNAHVVDGGERIRVAFDDGDEYDAELYGIDVATDLAVLKLDTDESMPVAVLGDSEALRVGEFVLALGAPFGLEATATSGIVSGLHRSGLGIARFEDFIVTDAPINRGNSGGPLVNLRGEVVGINTAIIAGDEDSPNVGTFAGVGFAIPVNVMRVVAQRLIGDGGLGVPAAEPPDGAGTVSDADAGRSDVERVDYVEPGFVPRSVSSAQPVNMRSRVRAADPTGSAGLGKTATQGNTVGYIRASGPAGRTVGTGTGFVLAMGDRTFMVTNEHVVRGGRAIRVYFPGAPSPNGVAATVLTANYRLDLALLALPDDFEVTALVLGDRHGISEGQPATALAARLAARGPEVARLPGQVVEIPVEPSRVAPEAQKLATDLVIERGDSGGPLLDADGDVIAVMVARDAELDAEAPGGRSYAIVLRERDLRRLLVEADDPGFDFGFQSIFPRQDPGFILVLGVDTGGLAEEQGLMPGDRIVSIAGQRVPVDEAAQRALLSTFRRMRPGRVVPVEVERENEAGEAEIIKINWEIPERPPVP